MREIKRDVYLNKLISRKENGLIKIITGIRRCGKSYLLDPLFKNYLLESGVKEDHIIKLELDKEENKKFRDSHELNEYIKSLIKDKNMYYILLDEIQMVGGFESVLNSFLYERNLDVYVTGSNSKFLSSDIITEFRGRGDEIKVFPLSFSEYIESFKGDKQDAWNEYVLYGGLPLIFSKKTDEEKSKYLKDLFDQTYIKDIIERNNIQRVDILDSIINILASSVGSLTNPQKMFNTFISNGEKEISLNTINSYIKYIEDSFIVNKSERYDVKGKKYIQTPQKYYFSDIGLRNARLNFRQQEENHIMENIIYNELIIRGYNVDVGVVEVRDENKNRKQLEVDFVCNLGNKRYYVQSALNLDTREKTIQEERPLMNINDNFKKIIVVKDNMKHWMTEEGILVIGIQEFLLNKNSLDL
ncbi:MAG: ATP-binding protein [Tenericutes bacterium]|nr:ATP-binding protein [Mycoplasmatota bacterium]MDD7630452.1 ATP-binding protein [bacterium]MDY4108711.1 ATP-binding protein [Bacilli bacterium]